MAIRRIEGREAKALTREQKWEMFSPYLKQHGSGSLAYSTLQDGLEYFLDEDRGYVAYRDLLNRRFILSDPIADPSDKSNIMQNLREASKKNKKYLAYCQITEGFAQLCSDQGMYVNCLGVENIINTEDFSISWRERRDLKRWLSTLSKLDLDVHENLPDSTKVVRVSEEWLSTKVGNKELSFMARPFVVDVETDVRRFYAQRIDGGDLLAFCSFDPVYKNGQIIRYALNHMRSKTSAPNGIIDFTIVNGIRKMKEEGVKEVSIGLSPLHDRSRNTFNASIWTDRIFNFLYNRLNGLYSFKKLGFHKDRYKADKFQTYFATEKRFTPLDILLLLRTNNVI